GGCLAVLATPYVSGIHLVLLAGALGMASVLTTRHLGKGRSVQADHGSWSLAEPFLQLRTRALLLQLGAIIALVATLEVFLDYALAARASMTLNTGQELVAFFAWMNVATSVGSLLLQAAFAQRSLERAWPLASAPQMEVSGDLHRPGHEVLALTTASGGLPGRDDEAVRTSIKAAAAQLGVAVGITSEIHGPLWSGQAPQE